jgi:hypothetical protein
MGEAFQIVIVTAAAAAAMVVLVRPYLGSRRATPGAPPCANCAASKVRPTPHSIRDARNKTTR